jgi:hypothetical protein
MPYKGDRGKEPPGLANGSDDLLFSADCPSTAPVMRRWLSFFQRVREPTIKGDGFGDGYERDVVTQIAGHSGL